MALVTFKAGVEISRTFEGKVKRVWITDMFGSEYDDADVLMAVVDEGGKERSICLNDFGTPADQWVEVTIDFPGAEGFGEQHTTKGFNDGDQA